MSSDPVWPQLLLQLVLILVIAFFACADTALRSLNEAVLRRQAEDGDQTAGRLLRIAEAPGRFLSAIQIGATFTGFLAAAFAADGFAGRIRDWAAARWQLDAAGAAHVDALAVTLITLALSCVTLVLGVLAPKRAAMQRAGRAARLTVGVISALASVLKPLIWLLTVSTNGVLRLLHIDPDAEPGKVSEEEIRMLVDIGEEKGTIESGEKEMIENIFAFNNMTAGDVMIHRTDVAMLWVEESDGEILRTIEESGLSRFPVYEEDADDVIGTLNTRTYLLNARRERPAPLRELLRPAYFVPESVRTDVLFRDMQAKKVHLAVVVDEYGGTSGIITMEDLLEEIVGDIYDEFDPRDEQEIVPLGENLWRVAGCAELEEVGKALGVEFPEDEEADTLGGLVFAQLPVIPEDGSRPVVDARGLHIAVEALSDRRVEWALVSRLPPESEEGARA